MLQHLPTSNYFIFLPGGFMCSSSDLFVQPPAVDSNSPKNVKGWRGWKTGLAPAAGNAKMSRYLFALLLGVFAVSAGAQDAQPTPEQLLATAVSIKDFKAEKIPGDWSVDGASWCTNNNPESGLLNCIRSNFVGWPAPDNISAYSAVNLFADATTAASAFNTRLDGDKKSYGEVATGPALGDESRYHARPAKGNDAAVTMVRFRYGRYLVLLGAESATKPLAETVLARLAKRIIVRLDQLDAGTLQPPRLPLLAKALPDADNSLATIFTESGPSDWWVYTAVDGKPILSETLRRVLQRGVGNKQGVARIYNLKDIPGHKATVTIMPFRNKNAAMSYLKASFPTEPVGNELVVRPPGIGGSPPWRWSLIHRVGRHVVEVDCDADDEAASPSCEPLIRKMDEQVKARLGS